MSNTFKAIVAALASDGIALAVAFGASLSQSQQIAILAFVGSASTAFAALVTWLETHHVHAAGLIAAAQVTATPPAK
jgi:hypothetical protein